MKVLIITVMLLLIMTNTMAAQSSPVDKGAWLVSGSTSLSSFGVENGINRITILRVNTNIGNFVSKGLNIGGHVSYSSISSGGESFSSWELGPSFRFVLNPSKKELPTAVYPYVGVSAYLIGSRNGENSNGNLFKISGGIMYMVTRSASLIVNIFYDFQSVERVSANTFGVSVGFGISIWE